VTAAYSHFPSRADGKNHVSGDLVLDSKVCMKGSESCLDGGDLGAVLGIPRLQQDLGVVLRNQVTQAANAAAQKVALQAAMQKSADALKKQLASGAPR
jgi:methyl coenzyme M reductase beta subunit